MTRQEVQFSEINVNIQGEMTRTLVDNGSKISVLSGIVLDRIRENNGVTFTTLPVVVVTIVDMTRVDSHE